MTRNEKLNELLDLALVLQNSYCGKTYDELEELYGFPRRRLERLISVLIEQFGDKVEIVENSTDRKKHFRLKKNTINSLISFSSDDFVKLEKLKQLLNDENEKKEIDNIISKIKALNLKGSNSLETDIEYSLETQGFATRQYLKEKVDPKIYEIIAQALLEQKKLQFNYTNNNGYNFNAIVHPYGIQYAERNYLVAYCEYSKEILKYKISKIKDLKKLDEYFEKDEKFNLKKYCEESFGIYQAAPLDVELLFDKFVKDDVLNYYFHSTQEMFENDDGSVTVKFKASSMNEICWNLYKWDDKVKIIAPVELIEYYQKSLDNILKKY